jgi:AAA family ATP:ADP antiporter
LPEPTPQPPAPGARLTPVERVLRIFTDVRPGEGSTALLMFANVFLILCAYYLLKPLREGWLAISDVGGLSKVEVKAYTSFAQTLLLAGVASAYASRVGRWPRGRLITRATLLCASNIVLFWLLQPDFLVGHLPGLGIAYYLWVGMFGVFVVAQFWAFAADLYSEERGRRLLPMIAIGATSGAIAGSWLERQLPEVGFDPNHLLLAALPPLLATIGLTRLVDARTGGLGKVRSAGFEGPLGDGRGAIPMVLGTPFLLVVAGVTLLFNWVKTNGENQLYAAVQEALAARLAGQGDLGDQAVRAFVQAGTSAFYGDFFFWVNVVALVLQALVASRLLRYGGFGALFLLLPTIALTAYSAMAMLPALWLIKTLKVAENATDYSLHNTARHVLWLPMAQEVTFKAKPTIDSLFVRAGDGMAALTVLVGLQLFSFSTRSFFAVNVVLAVIWLLAAAWIVREHARLGTGARPPVRRHPRRRPENALRGEVHEGA